ncbi:Sec-independent protein translocase protein TatB [Bosea sp. AAP35]|uniref:Sec-independent protein translocase protein TatB n=1 Tax=Bosea sp. AAP35 TaxID=1523417 RepID=UPI0006B9C0BB|nr:Sec-independent protein translocase protein TatB [Bosea sp. AAP35]
MFDIAWSEFMLVGAVALVVIGPKDLPKAMRTVGQAVGKMRRMASEFQGQFNDAMREAELHDLKKQVEDVGGSVSNAMSTDSWASDYKPIEMPASTGLDDAALKEAEAKLAAIPAPEPLPPVEIAQTDLTPPAEPAPEPRPKRVRKAVAAAEEPVADVPEPAKAPRRRKTAVTEPGEGSAT